MHEAAIIIPFEFRDDRHQVFLIYLRDGWKTEDRPAALFEDMTHEIVLVKPPQEDED